MKKLAIIVTGHTRGFYDKWMEHVFPILNDIYGCEPHFFFQTWNNQFIPPHLKSNKFVMDNIAFEYETRCISHTKYDTTLCQQDIHKEIESIIKLDKSIIDSRYEHLFKSKDNELADYASYVDLCNYYSQPFSWMKAYEKVKKYETDHSMKFDYLLKVRYDCFFRNSIKDVVNCFNTVDANILCSYSHLWYNFKTSAPKKSEIIPNGINDQWFLIKKSDHSDYTFKNLLRTMFKLNHDATTFLGRRYPFEQCFFLSLLTSNEIISDKHYEFIVMRDFWDFESTYENFYKYGIVPENEMTWPVIMNNDLLGKIKNL